MKLKKVMHRVLSIILSTTLVLSLGVVIPAKAEASSNVDKYPYYTNEGVDTIGVNTHLITGPQKTTYQVGEGFDTTGMYVMYNDNGKEIDVTDKVTFACGKTVVTQGTSFDTPGQNQILIYYEGRLIGGQVITIVAAKIKPTPTSAPTDNQGDGITWLGSETEYKKTLESYFDSGLRVAPVGDYDSHGNLNNVKYGLVDRNGVWAAKPVYDKIEAYYWNDTSHSSAPKSENENKPTESIFIKGYVQAVKNGKMGLLDSTGKEVIPCRYDAVGLPSEDMCRLIVGSNIGYWNLKTGTEVVAPGRYVISDSRCLSAAGYGWGANDYYFTAYNFHDGYALVDTGKTKEVMIKQIVGIYGKPSTYSEDKQQSYPVTLRYAQIIDKNGNEILPKAYLYNPGDSYPQAGPYMTYYEEAKEMMHMRSDSGDDIMFASHFVTGVVGKKGIVLPAKYHAGIVGSSARGWHLDSTNMQIIPELSMVITSKAALTNLHEGDASREVVSLSGKTIIPFSGDITTNEIEYNPVEKVFVSGGAIFNEKGKIISGAKTKVVDKKDSYTQVFKSYPVNGYVTMTEALKYYDFREGKIKGLGVVSVKNGTVYKNKNLLGIAASDVSTKKTLWVNQGTLDKPKWGLVNLKGEKLLPFEYEELNAGSDRNIYRKYPTWTQAENAYVLVKKDGKWGMVDTSGKILLPCKYSEIRDPEMDYYVSIQDADSGKYGVFSFKSKKITIPCQYDSSLSIRFYEYDRGSISGVIAQSVGNNMNALFDLETGKQLSEGIQGLHAAKRGTFIGSNNFYGPDGKILYPFKLSDDCTLIVRDGKVGYVHASKLAR